MCDGVKNMTSLFCDIACMRTVLMARVWEGGGGAVASEQFSLHTLVSIHAFYSCPCSSEDKLSVLKTQNTIAADLSHIPRASYYFDRSCSLAGGIQY